jgi:hypothetical protein
MAHSPSSEPNTSIRLLSSQPLPLPEDLEKSLISLLTFVCSETEWEYGETWFPSETYQILELSSAWYIDANLEMGRASSWAQFQACSRAFMLRPGEGMPGRVWQSHQSEWLDDVSVQSEAYFLRNQIATALGVKAGFGIPIIENFKVLAVVVFFMSKAKSPDLDLIVKTQTAVQNFQYDFLLVRRRSYISKRSVVWSKNALS